MTYFKNLYPLALLLFICSCSHDVYLPALSDKTNAPALGGRNEARFDASIASYNRVSLDGAYSPINHLGIMASYRSHFFESSKAPVADSQVVSNVKKVVTGYRYDVGLGYFTKFKDIGRFEVYIGFGKGQQNMHRSYTDQTTGTFTEHFVSVPYNRYFVQWGAGFDGKIFSLMAGFKFAYHSIQQVNIPSHSAPISNLFLDEPYHFLPYVDLRVGYKYIKFTTQFGWSVSSIATYVNNRIEPFYGNIIPMFYISGGFVFHFSPEYFSRSKNY